MGRASSFTVLCDTSLFTPLQIQPTAVGRIGFNAGTRWLRDHVASHRDLLWQHNVGFVLWAWHLEYTAPLRFEQAEELEVEVRGRARGFRSQFECALTIAGPDGVVADMVAASVPLSLSGDEALSGRPGKLPPAVVDLFAEDEVVRAPYRSRVPELRASLRRDGEHLAGLDERFWVHRHNCEVADQWYWVEALGYAGKGREALVERHGATDARVVRGLAQPVRRVDVSYLKTFQFRDAGVVRSDAYAHGDGVSFVHSLYLDGGSPDDPHAVVVEQF